MSLVKVAAAMDKTPGAITHWLNGHREITLKQFLALCQHSKLDPVAVLYPGYIPQEFRERVEGLAKDVLAAKPADRPSYRGTVQALKRQKATLR
jgi:5,10-methylenetetrahydrofolate reductase